MDSRFCPNCKKKLGTFDYFFCDSCGEKLDQDLATRPDFYKKVLDFSGDSGISPKKRNITEFLARSRLKEAFLIIVLFFAIGMPLYYLISKYSIYLINKKFPAAVEEKSESTSQDQKKFSDFYLYVPSDAVVYFESKKDNFALFTMVGKEKNLWAIVYDGDFAVESPSTYITQKVENVTLISNDSKTIELAVNSRTKLVRNLALSPEYVLERKNAKDRDPFLFVSSSAASLDGLVLEGVPLGFYQIFENYLEEVL